MRGTMMDFPLTLPTLLERADKLFSRVEIVSRRPDRSLLRTCYGNFYRRARQLASALTKLGLRSGDRVASMMWNHSGHLEAFFGVPSAGGILHTLPFLIPQYGAALIVAIITVAFELLTLAWIRGRFFRTGFLRSLASVTLAGAIIAGISAALGAVASDLGAGETQLVTQRHGQGFLLHDVHAALLAVDGQRHQAFDRPGGGLLRPHNVAAEQIGCGGYGSPGDDAFDEAASRH